MRVRSRRPAQSTSVSRPSRGRSREGWGPVEDERGDGELRLGGGTAVAPGFELVASRDLELRLRGWSYPFARRRRAAVDAGGERRAGRRSGRRTDGDGRCASDSVDAPAAGRREHPGAALRALERSSGRGALGGGLGQACGSSRAATSAEPSQPPRIDEAAGTLDARRRGRRSRALSSSPPAAGSPGRVSKGAATRRLELAVATRRGGGAPQLLEGGGAGDVELAESGRPTGAGLASRCAPSGRTARCSLSGVRLELRVRRQAARGRRRSTGPAETT